MSCSFVSNTKTVQFVQPFQVDIVHETQEINLEKDEVYVETILSSISPGTELLVYKGQMPTDLPTDAVFETQQASFSYPSRYGYAAVGTVTACGRDVHTLKTGDHVFAFREHTSAFTENQSNLMRIPAHISVQDATYLPNIETAISLAMDAAVLPGESICVVGQGIVGLLLVAVLIQLHPFSRVVSLDINEQRRLASTKHAMATASLDPSHAEFPQLFRSAIGDSAGADVSIDVSGSGDGLNTAIQMTRDYGRVVIGSWFGNKSVTLACLGGKFHRSHIQLVASQVSEIPAPLAGRWNKQRRFQLAWSMIEKLCPFQRFSPAVHALENAPQLYKRLVDGEELHGMFAYTDLHPKT